VGNVIFQPETAATMGSPIVRIGPRSLMFQYDRQRAVQETSRPSAAGAGIGLASIPAALWRRKWWPVLMSILFAGLGVAYSMTLSDRYQAFSQVLIDPRELRALVNEVSPNNLNSDSTTAYIESQSRIISSTNMLRRIVDREGLARDPEYSGIGGILSRLFPTGSGGDRTQRMVEQLGRNLWVRRGERTFIVDIAVSASTPEKAARLSNAFAAAYLEDQANARSEVNRRVSTNLTGRLNELRDSVRVSEEKIEAYKNQKNIVGASGKLVTEEQLAAVNSQLAFARSRSSDAKAKLDQLDSVRGQQAERGALPEAVNSQTLGLLRQQLGEAQRKAVNLSTSLGPMHPEYLAAQSTLRDAQRAVADEITRIRSAARAEFDRAVGNEKTLQAQVESLKKDTLSTSRDTVQLRELERELEANRAVYQSFLQRARETGEQERVDTTNARIIATAVPPIDKSGPPKRLIVTGAAAGGFALGLLLALLAELAAIMERRRDERETATAAAETATDFPAEHASARQSTQPPERATVASPAGPSANDDLLRMLRMLGQLEKAIQQNGMPR
jgi:uncharacterized protein involved in exopolysaccharide biosynthesis